MTEEDTYKEIMQQPAAWEDARQAFKAREDTVLEAWAICWPI